ncbi:MAG: 5-bromo-4-chloroindolyl phosphate hydrolysis family protein [Oscillospiraceae bacterium]|nr:5-bromo-4-chloroindolyl phosphate hydrolysis family protein [Oscillospiraceae bacterium]
MRNNKDIDVGSEIFSWAVVGIGFAIFWPVGVFLLIRKLKKLSDAKKEKDSGVKSSAYRAQGNASVYSQPAGNAKPAKKKKGDGSAKAVLLLILAIILFIVGASYVSSAVDLLSLGLGSAFSDFVKAFFWIAGGAASLIGRNRIFKRNRRRKKCVNVIGGREVVTLTELANQLGTTRAVVKGDLEDMIVDGDFGPDAYIDIGLDSFVRSFDAAESERQRRYDEDMKRDMASSPRSRYETVLQELRNLDDDIEDEPISEKIRRIEDISAKIFRIVEENPEKLSDTRRFMDYYLPTTLKLLRSYATLERQGINGDNISSAKEDINRILDTLTTGFEQQLDQLFRAEAMDISADIDVLESMMKNDGLTGDNPFRQQASH